MSYSRKLDIFLFFIFVFSIAFTNSKLSSKAKKVSPSATLSDCINVEQLSTKTNYITATCYDNNGNEVVNQYDLNKCFGNGHGQLKKGSNFSNSCQNIEILTRFIIYEEKTGDEIHYTNFLLKKKDGRFYLNAQCDKGKGKKGDGWSYVSIYDNMKVSNGVLQCK